MVSDFENATAVGQIFLNTNSAAAAGAISAMLVCKTTWGKADLTMILNGALAGLVAITADPLSPSPVYSVAIGAVSGALVVFSIIGLDKNTRVSDDGFQDYFEGSYINSGSKQLYGGFLGGGINL